MSDSIYKNDGKFIITCEICKKVVNARLKKQVVCSKECYNKRFRKMYGRMPNPDITGSAYHSGLISEISAIKKLLLDGFEVFRAVGFGQFADLVLYKNGKIYIADVKTGYKDFNDKVRIGSLSSERESLKKIDVYVVYISRTDEIFFLKKDKTEFMFN